LVKIFNFPGKWLIFGVLWFILEIQGIKTLHKLHTSDFRTARKLQSLFKLSVICHLKETKEKRLSVVVSVLKYNVHCVEQAESYLWVKSKNAKWP